MRGARNPVVVGQTWSIMNLYERRYLFTVDRIDGARVHGHLKSGRPSQVELKALVRGRRGAQLIMNADGTPAPPMLRDGFRPEKEETKTASDYVKPAKGPRGVVKAGEREALALQMQKEGKSCREIGVVFGITMGSVSAMLSRAREALREEQNLKALRTG